MSRRWARAHAPAALTIPRSLFDFFLGQAERYGGASDATLQRLRYLREAVFLRRLTPEQTAVEAERALLSGSPDDLQAWSGFAEEMRGARGAGR